MDTLHIDEAYESIEMNDDDLREVCDHSDDHIQEPYDNTPFSSSDSGFAESSPGVINLHTENILGHNFFTQEDLNQNDFIERDTLIFFSGDENGNNLLHQSVMNRDETEVFQIVQMTPNFIYVSIKNNLGQTPLHLAVLTNQPNVVRRLICAGAVVDVQDRYGNTPLHLASALGYLDIVKHLTKPVEYKETLINNYKIPFQLIPQNMSVKNFGGFTCLHLAIINKHANVIPLLLDAGTLIGPNFGLDESGRFHLHPASDFGNTCIDILLLLLERQEEENFSKLLDLLDFEGLTPAELAHGHQNENVERLFFQNDITLPSMDSDSDEKSDTDIEIA